MRKILESIGMWLLAQDWFRFAITKKVTSFVDGTSTKKDDRILEFVRRNKTELEIIIKREVELSSSEFDNLLLDAIKNTN